MSIKLIIFDLDGTLIDSLKDITSAVNHATRSYGIPEKSVPETGELLGTGISILIDRVLADRRDELKDDVMKPGFERLNDRMGGLHHEQKETNKILTQIHLELKNGRRP